MARATVENSVQLFFADASSKRPVCVEKQRVTTSKQLGSRSIRLVDEEDEDQNRPLR